jgi:hypothetical protein
MPTRLHKSGDTMKFAGQAWSVFILCAIVTPFAHADIDMQPGMWEQTTRIEMPGMSIPETRTTYCLRKEDLVPKNTGQPGCKITNIKQSGNMVTWETICVQDGTKSRGRGKVTYSGTTSNGSMNFTIENPSAPPMKMHYTFSARRVGNCK